MSFSDGPAFRYLHVPQKTAGTHDARGWTTLGNIGRLDEGGYLFLSDGRSFVIVSGGVNICPQESENLLVTYPAVAVIGVPCAEVGEMVLATAAAPLADPRPARSG